LIAVADWQSSQVRDSMNVPAYGAMSHGYALVTLRYTPKGRLEPGWSEVVREVSDVIRVIILGQNAITTKY
jgi:hypothetical protein